MTDFKDFYTALGGLVYAVAKADGTVQRQEVESVFHFVITQIIALEMESFDGRSALEAVYTEKEFNRLRNQDASVKEALQQFSAFYDQHHNDCDEKAKSTCLHIIEKVALAYNGIEPSELVIIENIRKKFSQD